MKLKKSNLYFFITSILLISVPSIGFDIHAHLLINSGISHFLGSALNFSFFKITFPRYNLLPVIVFLFSFGGILPASTFFIFTYFFLLKNFSERIDRLGFLLRFTLLSLFIYRLVGFGVLDISFLSILIFLITSKSNKPNSLNWLIYPGLISWPGLIISNVIILFYLVRNILNKKLFLKLTNVLIFNITISTISLLFTNYILPINSNRDYTKYYELISNISSIQDILDFPKLSDIFIFIIVLIVLLIIIILFSLFTSTNYLIGFSKLFKIRIRNSLLSVIIIIAISANYLFPILKSSAAKDIYPPLLYNSGFIRKSNLALEKEAYDNAFCSLYIPNIICRVYYKNYENSYMTRVTYVYNYLFNSNKIMFK